MSTPTTEDATSGETVPSGRYAIVGATGNQGGAVVDALLDSGVDVRALVRNPDSDAARALAQRGVTVVRADLDEPDSVRAAFADVDGVFAMTTFTSARGTDGEVENGRVIADAAADAKVPHLVYSSVGGAERNSGVPHFESKWRVEQYLRDTGVPVSVVRPTFFMENFADYFAPKVQDGVCVVSAPLLPDVPLQMIAVADIGRVAAIALLDPGRLKGGALEIAGDELTGNQIADAFGRQRGMPPRFEPLPVDSLGDEDQEAMFSWFQHLPAYQADFAGTRDLVSDVADFATFLSRQS